MKKIIGIALLALVLYSAIKSQMIIDSSGNSDFKVEDGVKIMVDSVNSDSPKRLNEEMVLDGAVANGREAIYRVSLTSLASTDMDAATVHEILKKDITQNVCGDTKMVEAIKLGVQLKYEFNGSDGKNITSVSVDQCP